MVRFEEIRQSCRIVEQALEQMPGGPVNVNHPAVIMPDKTQTYGSIEGLVNHFKIIMHGDPACRAGTVYAGNRSRQRRARLLHRLATGR